MTRASRALSALVLASLPFLPGPLRAEVHLVELTGGAFVPAVLTVAAGDTLRLVNRDGVPHTLTADDGSYDSGRLMDGDATQLVLSETGEHGFRCTLGGQRVRVLVEEGRGAMRRGGPLALGLPEVTQVEPVMHRQGR